MTAIVPLQPALGSRTGRLITRDNLEFRDLNGDGELNPYEDWRLNPGERAADLVQRMTPEEKAGLMIIGSHHPGYSRFLPHAEEGRVLNHRDVWRDANPITSQPYPEPVLVTSSTDNAVNVRHQRFLICRDNLGPADLATWTNTVQEVAENSRLGIPAVFASNPRNHVALVAQFGVNESAGVFSEWPNELGLAALDDADLMEVFGAEIAKEWRAGGLHKLYGYMADVASEPRWSRFNGTFGEDVELVTAYIGNIVRGMQGRELSATSVATTIKHFPGGGVRLDGHDPHFEWGQTNEYPTEGALEKYHLPPFQAACVAGASSIMPYYARPVNTSAIQLDEQFWAGPTTQFAEVAFAYNAVFLERLLRRRMGHRGYVNSDSGVIDAMVWGVEELSKSERFAAAVKAGTDIFSDMADPTELIRAIEQGLLADADLNQACTRLLTEIFALGLFENPYVDVEAAGEIIGGAEVAALGEKAQRQSVTLLRSDGLLPLDLTRPVKVHPFVTGRTLIDDVQATLVDSIGRVWAGAEIVDDPADAEIALVWARPEIALFEDDREGVALSVDPRANGVDIDRVREIEQTVPTLLVVNFTNPWLLGEIEPDAAAVIGTFEIHPDHLLRSLAGEDGGPAGRLPMSLPADVAALENSPRDVPGKYCGEDYPYRDRDGNTYAQGHGLQF
ncbi:glycoside hydrolase family 3 protein [Corynebacterium hylobatis]|uniref:beta-glucosidase n=1 Tax=Corynebacterium hylobatis TaxID=1859290 RepID=A0A3S0B666_9CORY|nr:glycoside hydrolase family 3 N-terminal domain-containing protein [Corynebacterium hylobatis]RSZ66058.1 glycoside hydrolase family 3 protein [Corynebacterium hylobatis]